MRVSEALMLARRLEPGRSVGILQDFLDGFSLEILLYKIDFERLL